MALSCWWPLFIHIVKLFLQRSSKPVVEKGSSKPKGSSTQIFSKELATKERPESNQFPSAAWTQTCKTVKPVIQSIRTFASPLAGITLNFGVDESLKQSSMVSRIMNLKLGPATGQLSFGRGLNRAELVYRFARSLPRKRSPETGQLRNSTSWSVFSSFLSWYCCSFLSVGLQQSKIYIGNISLRRHMRAGFFKGF